MHQANSSTAVDSGTPYTKTLSASGVPRDKATKALLNTNVPGTCGKDKLLLSGTAVYSMYATQKRKRPGTGDPSKAGLSFDQVHW